jgi:hypothetical protein
MPPGTFCGGQPTVPSGCDTTTCDTTCPAHFSCDTGSNTCKCTANTEAYCVGDNLYVCNGSGTGYNAPVTCGSGLCDAADHKCGDCNPGTTHGKCDFVNNIWNACLASWTYGADQLCNNTSQTCADDTKGCGSYGCIGTCTESDTHCNGACAWESCSGCGVYNSGSCGADCSPSGTCCHDPGGACYSPC